MQFKIEYYHANTVLGTKTLTHDFNLSTFGKRLFIDCQLLSIIKYIYIYVRSQMLKNLGIKTL